MDEGLNLLRGCFFLLFFFPSLNLFLFPSSHLLKRIPIGKQLIEHRSSTPSSQNSRWLQTRHIEIWASNLFSSVKL